MVLLARSDTQGSGGIRSAPRPTVVSPHTRPVSGEEWAKAKVLEGVAARITENFLVTPEMAAALLAYNTGNRPITKSQVQAHIDRLKDGKFKLSHHGIAVSRCGKLNDGQHRLTAIVQSGIPGDLQITFGAEREEFNFIDRGKGRTAADSLTIMGETNAKVRAAIAGTLLRVENREHGHPDSQRVTEHALKLRGPIMDNALVVGSRLSKLCSNTVGGVAYYWIATHTASPHLVNDFFEDLDTGRDLSDVKLKLREWLIDGRTFAKSSQADTCEKVGIIINAWNAYVKKKLSFSRKWPHVVVLPEVK